MSFNNFRPVIDGKLINWHFLIQEEVVHIFRQEDLLTSLLTIPAIVILVTIVDLLFTFIIYTHVEVKVEIVANLSQKCPLNALLMADVRKDVIASISINASELQAV